MASFSPDVLTVCLGDTATFECTVNANPSEATLWRANTTDDLYVCVLAHTVPFDSDVCGPFSAALGTSDGDYFPSSLTVTATQGLDNTLVECFSPTFSPIHIVGSGILRIVQC